MKIIKFNLSGDYAHFKIPYTNNNPLTHSVITKTALIGMIGAVIGIERKSMRDLYPILCDALQYSIIFNSELKKESISSYAMNFGNLSKPDRPLKSPKPMEYIKNPNWTIYLKNDSFDEKVVDIFNTFYECIENKIYVWRPTLGVKQCDCNISNVELLDYVEKSGECLINSFVTNVKSYDKNIIINKDSIPTHQNNEWYNDPNKYVTIYFRQGEIFYNGDYYNIGDKNLVFI